MNKGGKSLGKIYFRWFHANNHNYNRFDPQALENTEAVRRMLEDEKISDPYEFFYSVNKNDLIVQGNSVMYPPESWPLYPPGWQAISGTSSSHGLTGKPRSSASSGPSTSGTSHGSTSHAIASGPSTSAATQPWVSPTSAHHSRHIVVQPLPLAYLGLWIPELVVPTTATTTTPALTTTAASDPLPADLQSIDWNALFAEHQALLNANNPAVGMIAIHGGEGEVGIEQVIAQPPVNQEELDEIVAGLDVIPGVMNAGDFEQVIAEPPVNQEGFNEIMDDLNALLQVNAEEAQMRRESR